MLNDINIESAVACFNDWQLLRVTGKDRLRFLQGQCTQELSDLRENHAKLSALLNVQGRIQSFFIVLMKEEEILLGVPRFIAQKTKLILEKFIIMDDVQIELQQTSFFTVLGPESRQYLEQGFAAEILGQSGVILLNKQDLQLRKLTDEELKIWSLLTGLPQLNFDVKIDQLVSETPLMHYAVSLSKGCYLGKEVVSKIENNRGASYFPVLLKFNTQTLFSATELLINGKKIAQVLYQFEYGGESYLYASLLRDYRVNDLELACDDILGPLQVKLLPIFQTQTPLQWASSLLKRASYEYVEKNNTQQAIKDLNKAVQLAPNFADAYESLGVILGNSGEHQKAVECMDKLLEVDPDCVMAHTNKSLYLMKLGKIEQAELEKSLALQTTFEVHGKKAQEKAKELEQLKEELLRKESMFLQVLAIDGDDVLANYNLGKIKNELGLYDEAKEFLEKVIKLDSTYSAAFYELGRTWEYLGQSDQAKKIYKIGLPLATKKGELMMAGKIQERLIGTNLANS